MIKEWMSDRSDEQMLCQNKRQMFKCIMVLKRLLYQTCHLFEGPALLASDVGYQLVSKVKHDGRQLDTDN